MTKTQIAKKAVKTRNARATFTKRHGTYTLDVIRLSATGASSSEIATKCGISVGKVAAIKAHLTMGTYNNLLQGCNIKR